MKIQNLMDPFVVTLPVTFSLVEAGKEDPLAGTPFSSFKLEVLDKESGEIKPLIIPSRLLITGIQFMEQFAQILQNDKFIVSLEAVPREMNSSETQPQIDEK